MRHLPVFVYGTLRPSCGNYEWALRGRTEREQTAALDGAAMYDFGAFPYVELTGTPGQRVVGTLMTIPADLFPAVMRDLDGLEGYVEGRAQNHYDRAVVTITTEAGEQAEAYVYVVSARAAARVRTLPVIESGDWIAQEAVRPSFRGYARR